LSSKSPALTRLNRATRGVAKFYLDVDALAKLAHWNILQILPNLLQTTWAEIATVTSVRYRAAAAVKEPNGKLFRCKEAAMQALDCIAKMSPLPEPDSALLDQLVGVHGIDPGEAILLASTASTAEGVFITGDKRALKAIAKHSLASSVEGKILCLEQVLMLCLGAQGREWLLSNLCPWRQIDTAVSMVLGNGCDATESNLSIGLESYIGEIKRLRHPPLLA
jgi:hypothetical protein